MSVTSRAVKAIGRAINSALQRIAALRVAAVLRRKGLNKISELCIYTESGISTTS
jgi:hypothetical protein